MRSFLLSFLISFILLFGIYSFYNVQPILAATPARCAPGDTEKLIDSDLISGLNTGVLPDNDMCGGKPKHTNRSGNLCQKAFGFTDSTGTECCTQRLSYDYCAGDIKETGEFNWYCCIQATPTPAPTSTPTPTPN